VLAFYRRRKNLINQPADNGDWSAKSNLTIYGRCSVGSAGGCNSRDGLEDHVWPRRQPFLCCAQLHIFVRRLNGSEQSFVGSIKYSRKAIVLGSLLSIVNVYKQDMRLTTEPRPIVSVRHGSSHRL